MRTAAFLLSLVLAGCAANSGARRDAPRRGGLTPDQIRAAGCEGIAIEDILSARKRAEEERERALMSDAHALATMGYRDSDG